MNNRASGTESPARRAHDFPILGNGIYANHAAISPWPRATAAAVEAFARENASAGPATYAQWLRQETELRKLLAHMLNAPSSDDIALVRNTTEGVCIVASGLDWRDGDNIVTPADEFPTNRLAWDALQEKGVNIRRVDVRDTHDPENHLISRLDQRTRVLSVSSVQWTDGFRLDLTRLGRACRDNGTLFFVDAIQQFGALPVDVQACRIDCLAAGSHKWQMGPEGMGVFFCSSEFRSRLELHRFGWRMLDDPYHFDRPGRGISDSARRFEAGSPNMMGQLALLASLTIIEETGQEEVAARVLDNTARLVAGIGAIARLRLQSRVERQRQSGIVSFFPMARTVVEFNRELQRQKVVCAVRGEAIRLSPHFYQQGVQIDELLNVIENAARIS